MNVAENFMLRQMQQMAGSMSSVPQVGGNGSKDEQKSSFQDLMDQTANKDSAVQGGENASGDNGQSQKDPVQNTESTDKPAVETEKDQQTGKVQEMHGDPNAMAAVMDLFRPEIVDVPEEGTLVAGEIVEAVSQDAVVPVETVPEVAVPEMRVEVTSVPVEAAPVQETPQETVEQAPQQQEAVEQVETAPAETVEAAPEQAEAVQEAKPEEVEVIEAETEETAKPQEDTAEVTQHVFHEVDTTPMKVGESYKTVDTEQPHMEEKLADTVREAVEAGAERVEIQLSPANLGRITIEMTRSVDGVLEVVLHAANTKAAGLLGQHLDGLHAALQSYGQESVRVEVQRAQEGQEQHLFQHADPDGRGQQQGREEHHQQRQENEEHDSGDFLQKLRLGLVSVETI